MKTLDSPIFETVNNLISRAVGSNDTCCLFDIIIMLIGTNSNKKNKTIQSLEPNIIF